VRPVRPEVRLRVVDPERPAAFARPVDLVRPEVVVPEHLVVALEQPQQALRPVAVAAAVGQAFAALAQTHSTR